MDIDMVSLGKRLRNIRQKKNMTIEELAGRANLSYALVAKIERGEKTGSIGSLVAISNVLGVSIEDLLKDSLLCTNRDDSKASSNLSYLLLDCDEKETTVIIKVMENLKTVLKRYGK